MNSKDDNALWDSFVQDVTPLGKPKSSQQASPPILITPPIRIQENHQHLDLHGLTLSEAYHATKRFLLEAAIDQKKVTIVTGTSGEIKREFPCWFENNVFISRNALISRIEEKKGGGAYIVYFQRKKK